MTLSCVLEWWFWHILLFREVKRWKHLLKWHLFPDLNNNKSFEVQVSRRVPTFLWDESSGGTEARLCLWDASMCVFLLSTLLVVLRFFIQIEILLIIWMITTYYFDRLSIWEVLSFSFNCSSELCLTGGCSSPESLYMLSWDFRDHVGMPC